MAKRLNVDLPQFVHDELALLPGCKKPNVERLVIIWANKSRKQREKDEVKLKVKRDE